MKTIEPFWQWLVLTGAVVVNAVSGGITYSFGVIYTDIRDRLETPPTEAIIPAAIAFAAACGVAPFSRALAGKLGSRLVTVLGSIIASLGLILCSIAPTVHYYYAFFGLLVGGGYGMMVTAAWVIIRDYFGHQPGIANTLFWCGFPVGVFIMSLIIRALYISFSYFGIFIVSSAIMMNGIVCGLLFRPVVDVKMKGVMRETSVYEQMNNTVDNVRYTPNGAVPDKAPDTSVPPKIEQNEPTDTESIKPKDPKTYKSVEGPSETMVVSTLEKSWKFDDTCLYESEDENEIGNKTEEIRDKEVEGPKESVNAAPDDVADEPDALTREPSPEQLAPVGPTLLDVLTGVSEAKHLCNWRLILFLLACIVYSLGYGIPYCFLIDVARYHDYENSQAIWALSLIGLTSTVSIIFSGAFYTFAERRNALGLGILVTALAMIATGLVTGFVEYYNSLGLILLGSLLFGLFSPVFYFMRELILKAVLGESEVDAYVFLCTWLSGFGFLIGIPIAGWLREQEGDYSSCFVMAACTCGISAALLIPLLVWKKVYSSYDV